MSELDLVAILRRMPDVPRDDMSLAERDRKSVV